MRNERTCIEDQVHHAYKLVHLLPSVPNAASNPSSTTTTVKLQSSFHFLLSLNLRHPRFRTLRRILSSVHLLVLQPVQLYILDQPHINNFHAIEEARPDTARHTRAATCGTEVVRDGVRGKCVRLVSLAVLEYSQKSEKSYFEVFEVSLGEHNLVVGDVDEEIAIAHADAAVAAYDFGGFVVE